MTWIALVVLVALVAGVFDVLLELALWAVVLTALVVACASLTIAGTGGSRRGNGHRG